MSEPVLYAHPASLQTSVPSAAASPTEMAAADAALVDGAAEAGLAAGAGDAPGVAEWLAGRSVLLTGATGFLGQLLMEKIMRTCPDVATIFLLVRDKRGDPPERRIERMLEDPLFERVRGRRALLEPVRGDCALPGLGLSAEARALLQRRVSVVLHCAATVRFDASLRCATNINVRATRQMLALAREMPHLQAFVHLSTAYAHCPHPQIDERVYEPRMRAEHLLSMVDGLDDPTLDRITPVLVDSWPNTYCFTKAVAEDMVARESKGLPVCIIRPSMVINTYKEPLRGWTNNINGPNGLVMGAAIGILRTIYLESLDFVPDIIPGDIVVNAVLAAAWATARKGTFPPVKTEGECEDVPVYNCVTSPRKPITWRNFMNMNVKYGFKYPSEHCLWYYYLVYTNSMFLHMIHRVFLHLLPALIVDSYLRISGQKPMLMKAYKKIHKFLDVTRYFSNKQWYFTDTNVQWLWNQMSPTDKENFPFNVDDFDWDEMLQHMIKGLRIYFVKDPLSTLDKGRKKYNRLRIMHYTVVGAVWLLFLQLIWWFISFVW